MANLFEQEAARGFGHYQVLGVLGDGRLGRLYVAENRGIDGGGAIVALRSFHPSLAVNPHVQKVLREVARLAAGLRHPHIAATHELGEVDGRHFLTMEYLPGESLLSILLKCAAPTPMPPAIAAALVHQCAEALRYAHEIRDSHGTQIRLVHRDLRPANVFVTYQGMVKLTGTESGLLRADILESRGPSRDAFAYTAPEDMEGGAVDVRGDVFSMGVILWECLTGRPLFRSDTHARTQEAVRSRYVEPPSVFNPEVPAGLDEVSLRALSRDPRRRYQTAKEMSQAIDTAIVHLGRRPTSAAIAEWLEGLFGAERATLKTQIARGSAVASSLVRLRLLGADGPGAQAARGEAVAATKTHLPAPSIGPAGGEQRGGTQRGDTRLSAGRAALADPAPGATAATDEPGTKTDWPSLTSDAPSAAVDDLTVRQPTMPEVAASAAPRQAATAASPRRTGRLGGRAIAMAGGAIALLTVVAVVAFVAVRDDGTRGAGGQTAVTTAAGGLQIVSTPPGAQVLIDGDPSGLTTPARINGLRPGRKVEVRVDKAGYRSEAQTTAVPSDGSRTLSFKMIESTGLVRLTGVPAAATTYVDDQTVNGQQALSLATGPHRLRIEVSGQLFISTNLEVKPGEQTIQLRPPEGRK